MRLTIRAETFGSSIIIMALSAPSNYKRSKDHLNTCVSSNMST